jgi:hypothetical protein
MRALALQAGATDWILTQQLLCPAPTRCAPQRSLRLCGELSRNRRITAETREFAEGAQRLKAIPIGVPTNILCNLYTFFTGDEYDLSC